MSIHTFGKMAFARKTSIFGAVLTIIITGLACGLPFGGNPTPRVQEVIPSPTQPPLPTSTPQPLPPGLVESDPPVSGEMSVKGPITLFFNQPMDRSSVEAALMSQMQQKLTFTWVDDTTVVVYLSQDLPPDTALAFEFDSSVRSRQGLSLSQPIRINYQTAGYLRLVQFLPEKDAADVDPTSAIVASFNRPVVPLGADQASLPAAFSLDPAGPGSGKWLNTSTFIFYPEPALEGGKKYTVQINPELESTDGTPLEETFSWSFTTAIPQLLDAEPSTETPWPLDPKIILTFNQPMDRASTEENFSFRSMDGSQVAGNFEWDLDDTQLVFTPNALLPRNNTFSLVLDGQAQAIGGSPLVSTFSATVKTVPELSIARSEPEQGGNLDPRAGINLYFTSPLPINQDMLEYLRLEPRVSDLQTSVDDTLLRIFGTLEANTDYVLTVSAELRDNWGGSMGQDYQLFFHTNPLPPNVSIVTGADAIFLTPNDVSLIVQAVNVSDVPLTVGTVPLNDLFKLLGPNSYDLRQNYQSVNQVSFNQPVDLPPDQTKAIQLYLTEDQQALVPGIYYVRLNYKDDSGASPANIYPGPYLVVVSNIQLTFKLSATDALVWAVDLRTGQPLPNAPVNLYNEDGSTLASGATDSRGIFRTTFEPRQDPYSTVYAVMGEAGQDSFGMTFSNWTSGIEPWDFDINLNPQPPGLFLYLYTDRPIYRPGDTVYFRIVTRKSYNGRYSPADISSLPVTVYGAEGRELMTMDLPLTAFGTVHGQFELPQDAQPGYYAISSPSAPNFTINFQVASYRKPEINLGVRFLQEQVQAGQQLKAAVTARYFFDAPAGNLSAQWALYSAEQVFNLAGYQVGPEDTNWLSAFRLPNFAPPLGTLISQGEAETSPDGTLSLDFPTQTDDRRQRYTLEVTLQDESGLPVTGRATVLVNPESYYIGLRPDAWVGKAGEQIGFDVQTVTWEKKPAGDVKLRAEFQKVVFQRSTPASTDPFQLSSFTPQFSPAGSTDFVTSPDGLARLAFTPTEPGTYMLDVFNPDIPKGEGTHSQILVWVGGKGQAIWPNLPNSRLRLTSDRESYRPGDTAQIFIPNPYGSDITALLTIERSVIMNDQIITIGPDGYLLTLPLTNEEAPNIVVSVTLLGRDERGNADFRQGYLNLPVEPVDQELKVSLLTQPQRTGPGDEVQFEVQVTDSTDAPVQGEFSISVVDLAVLALADPNAKDILPAFYGEQPIGVRTSLSLAVYNRRLLEQPPGMGGGGGETTPSVIRQSFPDTAYWNGEIVTGQDGKASVKINLPDTLTTWKVDTRGLTLDTRVGQSNSQIITSKDLLVRPVTPRFFVAGDHGQIAAVVQNNTNVDMQVQVALQANGFTLDDPVQETQSVSLPAGGRTRVEWWGTIQDSSEVDLVFSGEGTDASGKQYSDAARPPLGILPVMQYTTPQAFRTAGILEDSGKVDELVSLPRSYAPSDGELDVELSPSLAAAMIRALDVLETSPFASTEQVLSSFLPNLETYRTLQDYGIQDLKLKAKLDQRLNEGLVRLLARQNFDGGWSWWEGGESDAYISAYVLFGLQRARLAGISINQNAIDQGISYLQQAMPQPPQAAGLLSAPGEASVQEVGWSDHTWEWDRLAFLQFTLSQLDGADTAIVEQIYQNRDRLSHWSQALLALTFKKLDLGSEEAQILLSSLKDKVNRSATGAYWELSQDEEGLLASGYNMQTDLSNTAIVIYALAQEDPGSPLIADSVRYLMSNRLADGAWSSTYTTAWTLIGLDQVLKGTGELGGEFSFGASLNGNPIADGVAGGVDQLTSVTAQVPIQRLYPQYPNALTIERDTGQGRLYYAAGLNVSRPVDEVAPLSNGLTIEREVVPFSQECQKGQCEAIQSAKVGEKVTVRLSLTLPHDMYYLAVTDAIPAGTEILDTSLKTTQIGQEGIEPSVEPIYNPRRPFAEGWGWWLFSQPRIYDDHISWTANSLPAGTYELTYTLILLEPGEYRVLPARAWELYFPEVQANSAGSVFEIKP